MNYTDQINLTTEKVPVFRNNFQVSPLIPVIQIRNLSVKTGDHEILKNINLEIPRNQIVVILGPSGCGKTTLLKALNRMTDLHRELNVTGKIMIDGQDILTEHRDLPAMRQKMGLLSQRPFPLPVSIYKNVAYGLRLKGVRSKRLIDYGVESNLRKVGLWNEVKDRLKSSASCLSIGQQQRLCLARGLAVKPRIILADEPTSALDPLSTSVIEKLFKDLKEHYTIVLVTHSLQQALRLADYAIFMYYGEVIEKGCADEILKNPQTHLLKQYLVEGS